MKGFCLVGAPLFSQLFHDLFANKSSCAFSDLWVFFWLDLDFLYSILIFANPGEVSLRNS